MSTRQDTAAPLLSEASASAAKSIHETPKPADTPKPVEAVLKVVADMKPAKPAEAAASPKGAIVAAASKPHAPPRSYRFALLAASIAFAGIFGAMAGALGTVLIGPPGTAASQLDPIDLTLVQGTMANLREELASIKSSVETSNRNVNAQLAKFTERLEKRAQTSASAPAARAEVTGSVRQAAAVAPRPRLIEDWVVRRVSRGMAVIQGHAGTIEVATGDIVPGIGRIESIRRLDGRWVVLTNGGMIASGTLR